MKVMDNAKGSRYFLWNSGAISSIRSVMNPLKLCFCEKLKSVSELTCER